MNSKDIDPLTVERIRMENFGKGFIIFLFAMLIFAGHYFLSN